MDTTTELDYRRRSDCEQVWNTAAIEAKWNREDIVCLCSRMSRDRQLYENDIRQLFVARSQCPCDYISAIQARPGEDLTRPKFMKVEDFDQKLAREQQRDDGDT